MKDTRSRLALPYILYMVVLVVLPLLVICYYAFTGEDGKFTMDNFFNFFLNGKAIGTLVYSIVIALFTTAACLLFAYPVAYILARGPFRGAGVLLVLFVMPMWINFTLRITALKEVLSLFEGNLAFHPFFNTIVCMTYDFLPFMIMPLYNSISKIDEQVLEAAADLGAKPGQIFFRLIVPMSMPGVISGVSMVFLPAMTNYVVLDMVYNSTFIMGSLIGSYFNAYDWHNGSLISVILLFVFGISALNSRASEKDVRKREGFKKMRQRKGEIKL
ncbi:MAG: ABC transporter permease [Lachnospiraceae bacterium]|nr:ABC transporter permease [Lachnospiraceae bacterium]